MYYMPCCVILFSALKDKSYDLLWSRILTLDRESVWGWRTMPPTCTRLVFLSDALQRLSFLGRIYIFHSIICFIIFLMTGTRNHVFSYVGISECFLTVLSWCCLILFGIAIINYLQSPFLSLSDLCMLLLGRYVSCWC